MAYVTTNPPIKIMGGGLDGTAPSVWAYKSADGASTVDGSGYITDGGSRGMKVNDYVLATDAATPPLTTMHSVVTVSATYPGAVDLSNGTTVAGSSNSD